MSASSEPVAKEASSRHSARPKNFFMGMAATILVVVIVGFAPSFYLRPFGNPMRNPTAAETLPAYIYVHGVVLSLWFLLLAFQARLVQRKNLNLHRRAGVAGAVLAATVFGLSTFVTVKSVARSVAGGVPAERLPLVVIGNLATLLLFGVLISAAIVLRRKPDWHKRFVMISSVALLAPALARWPGAEALIPISVIAPQLGFFAALAIFDWRTLRRLHPATLWGVAIYLVLIGSAVPFSMTEAGKAFVMGMK